ncbi:MAG TPA: type II secretion system F family protein, partial [Pseudomonas sp.]|nr:type II secretion system F family protein [Pseudomonas sp.]
MPAARQSPLALVDRAQLFTHLATMEQAGMPADKSFALLELPATAQASLTHMRQQLSQGQDLASAGQRAGLFTPLEVTLLQASLSAGSPAPLYRRLAESYRQKARNAAAIRARLWMPALVFAIALFIQPLPRLVDGTLGVGAYLWTCLQPLLLLLGGVWLVRQGLAWLMHARPSPRRDRAEGLVLALPLFGPFQRRCAARDFFESLGLMLEAGLPMFDALPKAVATIGHSRL